MKKNLIIAFCLALILLAGAFGAVLTTAWAQAEGFVPYLPATGNGFNIDIIMVIGGLAIVFLVSAGVLAYWERHHQLPR